MAILKWGSFSFVQDDPQVQISVRQKYNARKIVELTTVVWDLNGVAVTNAGLGLNCMTTVASYAAALQNNDRDLVLYANDGTTVLHSLLTGSSLGGTRVTAGVEYPKGEGSEIATVRTWHATIEADYPNTGNNILDWQDKIEYEGSGGPRYVFIPTLNGTPQQQTVYQQTTYKARQQGRSVGFASYVPPAPPMFPNAVLPERTRIAYSTPQKANRSSHTYVVEWAYEFESISPLQGFPVPV